MIIKGFRPSHRVLIRRIEAEERSRGGAIIPDTAEEKPVECEVLAGRVVPFAAGSATVLFGKWSGTEVIIGGEERLVAIRTRS